MALLPGQCLSLEIRFRLKFIFVLLVQFVLKIAQFPCDILGETDQSVDLDECISLSL